MPVARLFTIAGRVQGVFFRDSTRREALKNNLTGHAINLPNGNVEVLAIGEAGNIAKLAAWLERGPPLSRVESVTAKDLEPTSVTGFRTG